MKHFFVPPAFVLSVFITSHVAPGQGKILLPSMISSMFFRTNTPDAPVLTTGSATIEAAIGSDVPSGGDDLVANKISGSADLVPKQEVVRELAEATQQGDQMATGQDGVVASQMDVRAADAEAATEKLTSAASGNSTTAPSQVVAGQEATVIEAAAPVGLESKHITEEDAAKNSELLQSVSESAEASWISKVSKESAVEALLPLVALTPVLAAAGFHADIDTSSGAPLVRFPSIDYAVRVEDLKNYN